MPTLDIVIVNWNTVDLLTRCLDTVRANVAAWSQGSVRTIVVDNGSADGSVECIRSEYGWVDLIENSDNVGFARANNQGIGQSDGDFVLLLNSDTELHDGALAELVGFAADRPSVGAVGARLLNSDGTLQHACHPMLTPARELWRLLFLDRFVRPLATYDMERWNTREPRPVEAIKGACLMVRRAAFDEVGLLDDSYFMYTEEVDLCFRLARAGWELWYLPTAVVTHHGGASSSQMPDKMYLELHRSKVQFYRKMGGARGSLWGKTALLLGYLPRVLLQPQRRVYRQLIWSLPRF